MGKMKTKSAAAKRIRRTGSGKYMHDSPGQNHAALGKTARRQRRLSVPQTVDKAHFKHIETLLPYK